MTKEQFKEVVEQLQTILDNKGIDYTLTEDDFNERFIKSLKVKTFRDLSYIDGFVINGVCGIEERGPVEASTHGEVFLDRHHAISALAMAKISQLMPYYGGEITKEEWNDRNLLKYTIERYQNKIVTGCAVINYEFLAFHTEHQRNEFLKNNRELVRDYLML